MVSVAKLLEKQIFLFFFFQLENLNFSLKDLLIVNICALYSCLNVMWYVSGLDYSALLLSPSTKGIHRKSGSRLGFLHRVSAM